MSVIKSYSFPDGEIRGDMFFIQHIENNLIAKWNLVIYMGKLQKKGGVMKKAFLKNSRFVFKETNFGRGGPRVNDQ